MAKVQYPNPKFFKARDRIDWKKQGENLKEVAGIFGQMLKETDWKQFAEIIRFNQRLAVLRWTIEHVQRHTVKPPPPCERIVILVFFHADDFVDIVIVKTPVDVRAFHHVPQRIDIFLLKSEMAAYGRDTEESKDSADFKAVLAELQQVEERP